MARMPMALSVLLLAACGSGGGGSPGFTLSSNAVSFEAAVDGAVPPVQHLQMHVTDSRAAYAGAGYRNGESQPTWLDVQFSGSAPTFDVRFAVTTTSRSAGTYTSTITLGTADANGNVLGTQDVRVTYTLENRLQITTEPVALTYFVGGTPVSANIGVTGDGIRYRATADVPWLSVPEADQTAPNTLTAVLDGADLDLGNHTGRVTLTDVSNASDVVTQVEVLTVALPQLTVDASQLVLGGDDGLSQDPATTTLHLSTGTNTYPWSVSATTNDAMDWLSAHPAASQQVGSAGSDVIVDADRSKLKGGTYHGELVFTADVLGHPVSATLPVTLNVAQNLLFAPSNGVAFASLPSRQLLSRTVPIESTLGRQDIPWTATSNQTWLSVTSSGRTGENLTLTANPAGLAVDSVHVATVTVSSSSDAVENQETIQVGLWVGASDPEQIDVSDLTSFMAVNPVLPYLYYVSNGDTIQVLNIYTGDLVATWPSVAPDIGSLAMSTDGKVLYAEDTSDGQILGLDVATGAQVSNFQAGSPLYGREMLYLRPRNHPTLIVGDSGDIFDVASGEAVPGVRMPGKAVSASADGQHVWAGGSGHSPDGFSGYKMNYSALNGGSYQIDLMGSVGGIVDHASGSYTVFSNCSDVAVSPDGALVYIACGAPYSFAVFDGTTSEFLGFRSADAYPNSAAMGWNGHFFGGINGYYSNYDVWEYAADGKRIGTLRSASGSLLPKQLQPSGDLLRVVTISSLLRIQDAP